MEAFHEAVERWSADMLELDVHLTADGEVVVVHDETIERTTDGHGAVRHLTLERLQAFDAGAHFRDPEGRASFRGRGVRIPRFADVLHAFPRTRLNVEAKCREVARPLVALIRAAGAEARVLLAAEHERNRRDVRGYGGPWGASRRQLRTYWVLHRRGLGWLYTPAADALQVPPRYRDRDVVTPRFVAEAHRRNLPVHVWTVDEPDEMRRLLALGVDGIQTDRPDRLARVLHEEVGRPLPPGLVAPP
jgi:glycerophosphoryl diester phosphodiesterase